MIKVLHRLSTDLESFVKWFDEIKLRKITVTFTEEYSSNVSKVFNKWTDHISNEYDDHIHQLNFN